jgi:hypothetical protein
MLHDSLLSFFDLHIIIEISSMSSLSLAALQTLGNALTSQQQTVSRELHAFCYLCLADSESKLLALDKSTLANYNNLCKTAITQ